MKKLFFLMFLVLATLSACSQQKISFNEVDEVPKKIAEAIDSDAPLQVISSNGKVYTIVFHSQKTVEAHLETEDKTAIVKLDEMDTLDDGGKQYVYSLKVDQDHDTIDIKVNSESMSYPMIIID